MLQLIKTSSLGQVHFEFKRNTEMDIWSTAKHKDSGPTLHP